MGLEKLIGVIIIFLLIKMLLFRFSETGRLIREMEKGMRETKDLEKRAREQGLTDVVDMCRKNYKRYEEELYSLKHRRSRGPSSSYSEAERKAQRR